MEIKGCDYKTIEKDYMPDEGIFSEDSVVVRIVGELSLEDRRLLILYAELGSLRKVAKIFNCSQFTIFNKMKRIKEYFNQRLAYYNNIK